MQKTTFKISGMNCGSCAKMIKMELEDQAGVSNVNVDFNSAKAELEFDSSKIKIAEIKNKIKDLGYNAID